MLIKVTILQKNFTSEMNGKKNLKKIDDVKRFLWKSTSQISGGDKISCAKKLDASMMLPCECNFLNKIRQSLL